MDPRLLCTGDNDLAVASETVVRMSDYFGELKEAAGQFAAAAAIRQRGYFSATEDDEARGLLASYWRARSALFELIVDLRRRVTDVNQATAGEFLVPFAAALLLIDAARFLRDLAEDNPIVRRKFNEPDATLGIPAGTYDAVQRSLVSSRHAWHLYHALRFYELNQDRLSSAASDPQLRRVLEIVEALRGRLQVSVARFSVVKLRTRSDQWLRYIGRTTIVRVLYGLQKFAGEMMSHISVRPGHQPRLPDSVRIDLQQLVQTGDVLLVRKEFALTNYFLPGYWPHVALYLGPLDVVSNLEPQLPADIQQRWHRLSQDENGTRVLESLKDGVYLRPLDSPFASDSIVVLRPQLDRRGIAQAIGRALQHEGKPYDFDFDFRRSDRLVCTEVVYRGYDGVGPVRFELVTRAGRPTLSGYDLVQMGLRRCHFDVVAAYIPALHEQLTTDGCIAQSLVQAALAGQATGPGAAVAQGAEFT